MKTMHGRLGFGLREQIADARGADADEHLDELRAAQAEERHLAPRRRPRAPAASCRCPAGRRAARPWESGRRGSCTSSASCRNSTISLQLVLAPRRRRRRRRTAPSRRRRRRSSRGCARTTSRRLRRRPSGGRRSSRAPTRKSSGMTQPRISASQRLATSPVYLTPCASSSSASFGSSTRTARERLRLARRRRLFSVPRMRSSPSVTSCDLAVATSALELAVGNRLAGLAAERRTPGRARAAAGSRARTTSPSPGRRGGSCGRRPRRSPARRLARCRRIGHCLMDRSSPRYGSCATPAPRLSNCSSPPGASMRDRVAFAELALRARASPADRAPGAGSSASAAARRTSDRSPPR